MGKRNLSDSLLRPNNSQYIVYREQLGRAKRLWVYQMENGLFYSGGMFENELCYVVLGEWESDHAVNMTNDYAPSEYMMSVSLKNSWNFLVYYVKNNEYKFVAEINHGWHKDLESTNKLFLYTDEVFGKTLFLRQQENDALVPNHEL